MEPTPLTDDLLLREAMFQPRMFSSFVCLTVFVLVLFGSNPWEQAGTFNLHDMKHRVRGPFSLDIQQDSRDSAMFPSFFLKT